MKRIVQINSTANWGSTGHIAESIGKMAIADGWESTIAYGRYRNESDSNLIRIGSDLDITLHGLSSRLFDSHGLGSRNATKKFVAELERLQPDVIHLHNIHGYFLNYPLLFDFLKRWGGPVVWTLHDCWSFTGHCAHFEAIGCERWTEGCHACPQEKEYPSSLFADRSTKNFRDKRESFLGCPNLTLVPVSDWLGRMVKASFLKDYPLTVIKNGIDLSVFKPSNTIVKPLGSNVTPNPDDTTPAGDNNGRKQLLGVASAWTPHKGLEEFVKLRRKLPDEYDITLVGLTTKQIEKLPGGIKGIARTESVEELVDLYSRSDLLVNPTFEDTFPTVNLEALACGTPVLTYRTGGSPEAIDELTGRIVDKGDIDALAETAIRLCTVERLAGAYCRARAERLFDSRRTFREYLELYRRVAE